MAIINLTPPSATGGQAEQVRNLYSYLYQLTDRLNAAFVALDVGGSNASGASASAAGASGGMSADQARQYNELKSLIIKTGTVTKEYADKLVASLDSVYIAQSEWGTYEEQIHQDIEATASGIVESYNFQSQIDALDDYRIEASGYILRGIIGYDENNVPIFGIAIGQDLKTTEVTIDGVTYKQVDMTKNLATYTADGITFWLNGVAVARLNQQELSITRAVITDKITLGDWEIATNGTGINKQVGTALDISGNSAITSLVSGQEGMQTQITQNAESISAKASQTEVDALTGRVTQTEADIEAMPDTIILTVNENGFTGSGVEIKPNKVEVKSSGTFKVASGDVDISTSNFSVCITDEAGSEDELLTIDATGVRAANLSAPNVAQRYDGPGTIIVNSGATSAQVESGGYARSIQEVFDRINDRFLPYTVNVTVQTDTYENLSLHGVFGGAAALLIDGGGNKVYGWLSIDTCHLSRINVENLGVYCNSNRAAIEIWTTMWVRFAGCLVEGYSTATSAFYVDRGSVVMLYNSEMYNCSRGIYAGWGTNVDFHTLKGTCTNLYLEGYGTRITGNVSRPSGDWSGFNIISNFADMTTIPIDNGSGVVAPTTGSATFNPSATGTYTSYWWSGDSDIRQGYTKSNGRIKGGIFYAVSGVSGTVKSAILKLTRLKNYGKGSAVQVKVYGTTSAGKSGNPALSTEGYVLGNVDEGQTADFALPEALAIGLGNGTYKGIILYADDTTVLHGKTYSTNYARFTTAAPLTITWTT